MYFLIGSETPQLCPQPQLHHVVATIMVYLTTMWYSMCNNPLLMNVALRSTDVLFQLSHLKSQSEACGFYWGQKTKNSP